MCFFISKKYPNELTAKRDIVCYKLLRDGYPQYESGFGKYQYNKRNPPVSLVPRASLSFSYIMEGYHSYRERKFTLFFSTQYLGINQLVKFIIPKGAKYYKNDTEYVSSTIIRKKIIKRFK